MNYFLGIDVASGVLVADFEDASDDSNHPVSGATPVTSNVWHHAAATYDTTTDTWRLYLDGILDRTLARRRLHACARQRPPRRDRQRAHQHRRARGLLPGHRGRGPDLEPAAQPAHRSSRA